MPLARLTGRKYKWVMGRPSTNGLVRPREVTVRAFPQMRRLALAAVRLGRGAAPMHGLLDVDITEARNRLEPRGLSLTAFIVASVARVAAAHPEVHAYRNWRGQLILHEYVDVATIIEVFGRSGSYGVPHMVRDADVRGVPELSAELASAKRKPAGDASGRLVRRFVALSARLPGALPALVRLARRSVRLRRVAGTVSVTAVGMFAGGGGFGIAPPGPASLKIVVGGMSTRPRVVQGQVVPREVLDLTVSFDHNVVDGAPAARFVSELRALLESAELLSEPVNPAHHGASGE